MDALSILPLLFSPTKPYQSMISSTNMHNVFLQFLIVVIFIVSYHFGVCLETDTIGGTLELKDSDTIVSSNRQFNLGFFSPNGTSNRYLGIWYNVSPTTVVWVANRQQPIKDSSGAVSISSDGNIVLMNGKGEILWSSNITSSVKSNKTAQLRNSGNFVLIDSSSVSILWESHKHPVDSFLPTMSVSHNPRTGELVTLNSWKSSQDPGHGNFTFGIYAGGTPQLYIWDNGVPRWRSGPWNGSNLAGTTDMISGYDNGFSMTNEEDGTVYFSQSIQRNFFPRIFLDSDGYLVQTLWDDQLKEWNFTWKAPGMDCEFYNKCGSFALCDDAFTQNCNCMRGYVPANSVEWKRGIWSGGCVKKAPLQCESEKKDAIDVSNDKFFKLTSVKLPDFMQRSPGAENECQDICLKNCSCIAYAYVARIGCMVWSGALIDVQQVSDGGSDLYIRVPSSELDEGNGGNIIATSLLVASSFLLFCVLLSLWICKKKGDRSEHTSSVFRQQETEVSSSSEIALICDLSKVRNEEMPLYSFAMLVDATNNFNQANKLGTGGFGHVYRGKLENGQEIAVKRLSKASSQGQQEFMNEAMLISKLQHRNLVRLLGCCVERGERMLVYEYLENGSLDNFLFRETQQFLDWGTRFSIIEGIGRGLLYLHRDSRLRIIHRDLKPSNILMDQTWIPKISDFGMARIFGGNQDQDMTAKVVGTFGYMAPEYAMRGRFSEKSDVYSFGVLILEILSGKRNSRFYNSELELGLLGYAWKLWNEDNAEDVIDEKIWSASLQTQAEMIRCIHIGLLCVQGSAANRPAISTVLSMLMSEIADLPRPKNPGITDRVSCLAADTSPAGHASANMLSLTMMGGR